MEDILKNEYEIYKLKLQLKQETDEDKIKDIKDLIENIEAENDILRFICP